MQTLRYAVLVCSLLALASLRAHAQTPIVLAPGAPVKVAWDAPAVDPTGATTPTHYVFETFREVATGVVVTTTEVPVSGGLTATLPSTILPPDGAFLLAVRAKNGSGVSDRSNALFFVRAGLPGAPSNLRIDP